MKTLIIYYSRSGFTKILAKAIRELFSGDIEEIVTDDYPKGAIGYLTAGRHGMIEKMCNIKPCKKNPADYDLVIIGGPIWAWNLSPPIRTYLHQNKDNLPKISFFCTMDGSGFEKAFDSMSKTCGKEPVATLALKAKKISKKEYHDDVLAFFNKIGEDTKVTLEKKDSEE